MAASSSTEEMVAGLLATAQTHERKLDFQQAIQVYRKAQALLTPLKDGHATRCQLSVVINNIGMCFYRLVDFQHAEDAFTEAIRHEPSFPTPHFNRGEVRFRLANNGPANKDLSTALSLCRSVSSSSSSSTASDTAVAVDVFAVGGFPVSCYGPVDNTPSSPDRARLWLTYCNRLGDATGAMLKSLREVEADQQAKAQAIQAAIEADAAVPVDAPVP